jgi:hypothetical protein
MIKLIIFSMTLSSAVSYLFGTPNMIQIRKVSRNVNRFSTALGLSTADFKNGMTFEIGKEETERNT